MPNLSNYAAARDTVWLCFPNEEVVDTREEVPADQIGFCVARMNNPNYQACIERLSGKGARRSIRKHVRRATAETILVDWCNWVDDSGEPVPYDIDRALATLSNPAYGDVYSLIMEVASNSALYRDESLQETAKNSSSGSDGTAPTDQT